MVLDYHKNQYLTFLHYLAVFCTFSYGREWVISDERPPCDISKTRANLKKQMSDSDSAPLKTPETSLTLPAKNIVLTSVIYKNVMIYPGTCSNKCNNPGHKATIM